MIPSFHRRWVQRWLTDAVNDEPVIIVTGARQTGKSTLLKHTLADWNYVTLDDLDVLDQATKDPSPLMLHDRVVFDEAQRAPKLFPAIKKAVDTSQRSCRFVVSGSANMLLMNKVTESLAGRAVMCHLRPFTWGEYTERAPYDTIDELFKGNQPVAPCEKPPSQHELEEAILYGWMPTIMLERRGTSAARWMEGYITSYLERDLRQLSQIESLPDFRRLMSALALRSGQLLNQTEICRDISMKQPTAHRYSNIIEMSMLFERLPAYAVNRTKRLMKSPKPYFVDSGLAAFLAGTYGRKPDAKFWGALFETAVFHHLKTWCDIQIPKPQLFYWRTSSGIEVDFVIERGNSLIAVEAKASSEATYSHAESLRMFMDEYPETTAAAVIYLGDEVVQLDAKIFAIPFHCIM